MAIPYVKRRVTVANGATASSALLIDTNIDQRPLVLCGMKPSAAITANTAKITMCPTETGTYAQINDANGVNLTIAMAAAVYTQLQPSQYAVFENYIKVEFSAGVSAAIDIDLYFRPAS